MTGLRNDRLDQLCRLKNQPAHGGSVVAYRKNVFGHVDDVPLEERMRADLHQPRSWFSASC
ncbi:hypothetical protein [uncultured Jannaschia sp.]|uniref:hypothetical protein n=1 Tax=uncultured Jannaschia sp. TaxID=293347 RepID=UPI002629C1EE|nr:hypothetical protein [uncultured Jannaschia sp.]